jgi:hypothetical protein
MFNAFLVGDSVSNQGTPMADYILNPKLCSKLPKFPAWVLWLVNVMNSGIHFMSHQVLNSFAHVLHSSLV